MSRVRIGGCRLRVCKSNMQSKQTEQVTIYICSICGKQALLGFYEAQRLGWYWKRRVGIIYDYYCPECNKVK